MGDKRTKHAATGTKQIWVKNPLHRAVADLAKEQGRTIRETTQRLLLAQLGYEKLEDLEENQREASQ